MEPTLRHRATDVRYNSTLQFLRVGSTTLQVQRLVGSMRGTLRRLRRTAELPPGSPPVDDIVGSTRERVILSDLHHQAGARPSGRSRYRRYTGCQHALCVRWYIQSHHMYAHHVSDDVTRQHRTLHVQ